MMNNNNQIYIALFTPKGLLKVLPTLLPLVTGPYLSSLGSIQPVQHQYALLG